MNPREFLVQVLPEEGYYCLAFKTDQGVRHRVYDDIDTLLHNANAYDTQGCDVYFCVSTLAQPSITENGKFRVRVGSNCLQTRSLILDVDIRADKPGHHTDFKEALQEIAGLTRDMKLAVPTIVHTGGGFHVYWSLEQSLSSEEWAGKANHFKSVVLRDYPKLGADPTRISDRASILRVPGTHNHKRNSIVRILKPGSIVAQSTISTWTTAPTPKKINGHAPAINLIGKSPPVKFDNIVATCPQLVEMASNGGANCNEPLWYATLSLVKHADTPNLWAHKLSAGHAGYDYAQTEAKLAQAISTNTGPTTCRKFSTLRSSICDSCPLNGKITSPIQLVNGIPSAATATPQITFTPPFPYVRRPNGGIAVVISGEEGQEPQEDVIYDYDLFALRKLRDEATGEWLLKYKYFQPMDGWREEVAPLADFHDKKSAFKTLMRGGVVPTFGQGTKTYNVGRYMVEYVRHLEKQQRSSNMYSQFGWRHDDTAFVVGDRMYTAAGVEGIETSKTLQQFITKFVPQGSLQRWADVFDVYNHEGLEPYAFGALLAFASPLYKFTGHSGVIFNMVGEKGSGKSSVLKIIASVWMKPEEQILKESDTVNSAEVILGAMHNLPVTYDEITNIKEDKLSDLCYNITQGRGRNRLSSDARLKANNATWSLILCSSSNLSLIDKLSQFKANSSAEAIRVFEVRIDGNGIIDKATADAALKKLEKNYGVAGDVYARYLVDNKEAILEQLEITASRIEAELKIRSPERFWSALLACVFVGGQIAKDLGLHRYDMDKLYAWAAKHVEKMRATVEEKTTDAISVLGNFLGSKVRNTLVVIQGKPRDTLMPHLRDATHVRLEIDKGLALAYVDQKAITDYCKLNAVSMSWLSEKLKEEKVLVETGKAKRINAGANDLPALSIKCWVLNLARQEFRADIKAVIEAQQQQVEGGMQI